MVIVYDKKSILEGVNFFCFFFTRTDPAVDCRNKPVLHIIVWSNTINIVSNHHHCHVIVIVIIIVDQCYISGDIPWSRSFVPLITDCPPTASHCTLSDNIHCAMHSVYYHTALHFILQHCTKGYFIFLAVHNSSLGDLVTHWVTFTFDITEWP